jgi:ABC-type sulfate/molybdate transport systems ATPase subunit
VLDLSLNARRGGFHLEISARFAAPLTVVFGHSGAGKSTLLRLLAGLDRDRATSARVLHHQHPLADTSSNLWLPPGRRQTALVAQQPALFPHLSVRANIAYGLASNPAHLDRSALNQRVKEMLQLVDGMELIDRRPRSLSGGEAQRIALARALAPSPKLLLLDEPFSALDGPSADALLDRLQAWARANGVQTIMATHEAADAFATNAEVALLHDGRLAAQGPAPQVLASERARLAARLAFTPPSAPAPLESKNL